MRTTSAFTRVMFGFFCAVFCMISVAGAYVPGELIVKFKQDRTVPGMTALSQAPASFKDLSGFLGAKSIRPSFKGLADTGGTSGMMRAAGMSRSRAALRQQVIAASGIQNVYTVEFDVSADILNIARQLQNDPAVEFAEPNYIARVFKSPNDHYYTDGTEWYSNVISCPGGWDITTGSSSIIVAVIDTGISANHEEFTSRLLPGYNFVSGNTDTYDHDGHGTMTAGVIGANGDNLVGIAGMDWNARILPIKGLNDGGVGTYEDLAAAVYWAIAQGADVINMSFGGESYSSLFDGAVRTAANAGVICVAAMGNEGDDRVNYPAGLKDVISVGATNRSDQRAAFSTYGSGSQITEVSAPGVEIISAWPTNLYGGYMMADGTSFAAPMVSGLCALLLAKQPTMSAEEMRVLLHATADDVGKNGPDKYCGFGRINVNNALKGIVTQGKGDELSQLLNFPNPADEDGTTFSFFLDDPAADIKIKVFTTHGELVKTIDGVSSTGAYHKVHWDCADERGDFLPNGSYIYVVIAEGGAHKKIFKKAKMAILR